MKYMWSAAVVALLLSVFLNVQLCEGSSSSPNVVVFLVDDLGRGDIGAYGNHSINTPSIDQLASEGIKFTQAYVSSFLSSIELQS